MELKVAISKLVDNKAYFGDFDVAGDANHDKNGDGMVSLLDVRRIASGKKFNGGTYPPDEVEIAQTILGNLKEFNGGIGNKPVFTLDDLKKFDPNAKDKGTDPVDESTSSKQKKFSLLLNVFDQLDDDKNGKIDNNDITRFLNANPGGDNQYKATKDALKDIRDNNLLKELDPSGSVTKGQLGDYVGKQGKPADKSSPPDDSKPPSNDELKADLKKKASDTGVTTENLIKGLHDADKVPGGDNNGKNIISKHDIEEELKHYQRLKPEDEPMRRALLFLRDNFDNIDKVGAKGGNTDQLISDADLKFIFS